MDSSGPRSVMEEVVSAGPYTAAMPRSKKAFAVVLLSCSVDSVGLKFKGPDRDNMPPSGDVMVSVSPVLGQYYSTRYSCCGSGAYV